ncbi:hypothetical protein [Duganella sp. FT27W]|uniref:hypothetical protein n=1 Tax=Duganella sp. FT27W TaxID=2654636 RepID=UPI00128D9A50|nr:hypothetical protein [Duganella sp. FT27W]MPQ55140.1 hypothetical protein [Duganella sp. FT27W]
MENLQTLERSALIACLAASLCACGTSALPPVTAAAPRTSALPAPRFDITTQVGTGQSTRYVYCAVPTCPVPSVKTAVLPVPTATPVARAAVGIGEKEDVKLTVDIGFPFNSSRVSNADRHLLSRTAQAHPNGQVEMTARSDFVGPPAGQRAVIAARARAMRSIVARLAPGAQMIERQEVAAPRPVARAEQAMQRRGSVRFTPPADVHMKGNAK